MKKFLSTTCATLSILMSMVIPMSLSNNVHAQCCTYTISMQDSYGDGWNGGYLSVYVNDTLINNFYATGWGSSASFELCQDEALHLFYTPLDYENENTYQIYDEQYNLVFEDGPNPKTGEVLTTTGNCNGILIPGNNPCTAFPIDTGECVVVDNSLIPGSGVNFQCANYQGNDAWLALQIPTSGNLQITADDSDFQNTGLAIWLAGADCSSLQRIHCEVGPGFGVYPILNLYNLTSHQTLFIQLFAHGGGTGVCSVCVEDLGTVKLDSSELPIITIRTLGQTIVNEPKIDALMEIRYNGVGNLTYITDPPNEYDGHIGIEIRGASSAGYPQTPYGLETRDDEGEDMDASFLSMPEESDWVLISNFNDRSLVRNPLAHYLFTSMGNYSPRMQLVEVMLDSVYKGIYVFGEKIKRDKNRVDIAKLDPEDTEGDDLTGGYILQQNYWDPSTSFESNYSPIDHPEFDIHFVYEYPKPEDITQVQKDYIAAFIDTLETALYSDDFTDPENGYGKYLDTKSFIDYFLVNEVSRNNDGFKKSVFFHKDRFSEGGKLKAGPVWDFDWAWKNMWGCSIFDAIDGSGWAHHINDCPTDNYSCGYYIRLLQDSTFNAELRCTYDEYRETILSTDYIFGFIDSVEALVVNAQARHFQKWPILGISGPAPEVGAVATTYAAELDTLKAWIAERIEWLDINIPGLCEMSTGVDQHIIPTSLISCAPNPSEGDVRFSGEWNELKPGQLEIYNAIGQPLQRITIDAGQWIKEVYLEGIGVYFYVLRGEGGVVKAGRVMVK